MAREARVVLLCDRAACNRLSLLHVPRVRCRPHIARIDAGYYGSPWYDHDTAVTSTQHRDVSPAVLGVWGDILICPEERVNCLSAFNIE